jgi:hypothetical protein
MKIKKMQGASGHWFTDLFCFPDDFPFCFYLVKFNELPDKCILQFNIRKDFFDVEGRKSYTGTILWETARIRRVGSLHEILSYPYCVWPLPAVGHSDFRSFRKKVKSYF